MSHVHMQLRTQWRSNPDCRWREYLERKIESTIGDEKKIKNNWRAVYDHRAKEEGEARSREGSITRVDIAY